MAMGKSRYSREARAKLTALRAEEWCVNIQPDSLPAAMPRYFPGLARYPGDPEAYADSRSEIRETLASRGWGASGLVDMDPKAEAPEPDYTVAEDIVERHAMMELYRSGQQAVKRDDYESLKDDLRKKLSGTQGHVSRLD